MCLRWSNLKSAAMGSCDTIFRMKTKVIAIVAVDLSELYLKRAGAVAEQQASRTGWRLAKVLGE